MSLQSNTPARIAHGGKAVYGARLGILKLEARFPRIPGDMGNALSWPFPVLYKVVRQNLEELLLYLLARAVARRPAYLELNVWREGRET